MCVNPEFMREGTAIADFLQPSMTIIGSSNARDGAVLRELYSWAPGRIFETSFRSAEMVKYVCNAWHAVKVAFANEVGTLAKELKVDAESVTEIFTADNRPEYFRDVSEAGFRVRWLVPSQRRPRAQLSGKGIGPRVASVPVHHGEQ